MCIPALPLCRVRQDERSYCYVPVDDGEGGPGAVHEGAGLLQGTQLQLMPHKKGEGMEANKCAVGNCLGNDNREDGGLQGWGSAASCESGRVDSNGSDDGQVAAGCRGRTSMKEGVGVGVGLALSRRGKPHQPLLLQKGCKEFVPVECLGVQQQQQQQHQQQPQLLESGRMRKRTNWRFYWTWAKRLLLIRALLYMLPS
eukprot:95979-Pelagomonas_calceolata.AAC.1